MLSSVEQASVGRDEIRAPLKSLRRRLTYRGLLECIRIPIAIIPVNCPLGESLGVLPTGALSPASSRFQYENEKTLGTRGFFQPVLIHGAMQTKANVYRVN